MQPLVSICCITYNHAPYISETLESFLSQRTMFPYEIIICDDASIDETAQIITEYVQKYPGKITFIQNRVNKFSKGTHPIATDVLPIAQGKYIALCEGDDYWISTDKLQMQVDFLENNSDYSGSAHHCLKLFPNGTTSLFKSSTKAIYTVSDLLGKRPFHTASFLFRASALQENPLPPVFVSYDKALFLLIALKGKIKYMDSLEAIYRIHSQSITHQWSVELLERDKGISFWLFGIDSSFPKYVHLSRYYNSLFTYPKDICPTKAITAFLLFVFYSFSYFPYNFIVIYKQSRVLLKKLIHYLFGE